MHRRGNLGFGFLLALAISRGLSAQTYESTRVTDYSAVRLSYDDLSGIVTKIQRFVDKANANERCSFTTEKLTVDDGVVSIGLHRDYSSSAFSAAPQTAYSVNYHYDGCSEAPILSGHLRSGQRWSPRIRPMVFALAGGLFPMLWRRVPGGVRSPSLDIIAHD